MALQLIYTSAAQLLDSSQSGYGIVARSEVMPREMRRKLTELSRYRTGSCRGITGPQCAYTTLTYANSEYHVLTVSQPAGADYSGRMCHLSHHLVLLPEEVDRRELELAIQAIAKSMCSLEGVEEVQFLVDGEFATHYGAVDIEEPYTN